MKNFYEKLWVSLFFKIKKAQNDNENVALIMSISVLTITNIINYYLVCYLFVVFFKINLNINNLLNIQNRAFSIFFLILIFVVPNYLLFITNKRYLILLEKYKNTNTNLGFYYFITSCILVLSFVFATIIFPQSFGLLRK